VLVRWKVASGSTVTLNDSAVAIVDSMYAHPAVTTSYRLVAAGTVRDTASITVTVVPRDAFNRALGRLVSVSGSSSDPAFANPQNAVDGDTATQWVSANVRTQFQSLVVDLGQNIRVNRVVVKWGAVVASSHSISLRTDGGVWRSVRSITNGTGGTEVIDSLNEAGREIQLFLGRPGSSGFAVRELEVYGLQETSSVGGGGEDIPREFALFPNYPNPFNPNSDIRIQISEFSIVRLAVYDLLGREVSVLVNEAKAPGTYTVRFDGSHLASGVYICRMTAGEYVASRKMLLIR
jgi:hypothetical protein